MNGNPDSVSETCASILLHESQLTRRPSRDAEDEALAIVEALAHFEILKRYAAGDGLLRQPVGETPIDRQVQVVAPRAGRLFPILRHRSAGIVPVSPARKRLDGRRVRLVGGDGGQHVAARAALQLIEREDSMRGEVGSAVIGIELEAAGHFVLQPELPGARLVAHGRGEDAVFQRRAAGRGVNDEFDLVRRIAALADGQADFGAVVESLHAHLNAQLLRARCEPRELAGMQSGRAVGDGCRVGILRVRFRALNQ